METKNKRATVYLDPKLHRALKIKSAQIDRTISELVNEALRQSLAEDYEDLLAIEERQNEPNVDFKDILKDLKNSGKL
ncbi:MAG: CopG family transcriptional regulator [Calditrichales bacterium]|nr:MAG: CopG family transcriptional regulator [Calditrichales bacterium]